MQMTVMSEGLLLNSKYIKMGREEGGFLSFLTQPKTPPQVRQNVSLLRVCLGLKNFLGPRDPKRIGRA